MREAWVQFLSWKLPWRRNGNPLQYSCLESPMDKGAWQATVHEVTRVGHNLALSFWGRRTWRWNEVVSLTYWAFAVLVQLLSHVLLFTTPWTAAHQASLSFTTSSSLLKTYVCWVNDVIQLSCPLWSPSLPALNLSQDQSLFQWISSLHQVAKVLELQLQHQSFQESVQFSHSVVSDSLRPHGLQHARLPCPSPTPGPCSNSCPSSWWCHSTISSFVIPFSSCLQFFPVSRFFLMTQFFTSSGLSIGISALASVLPMNIQDWFPLGWTGWISLQSKGLLRVFSNTTVQKNQFFSAQLSLWSNSHIHTWLLEKT